MCGINGMWLLNGHDSAQDLLAESKRMSDQLAHRGPDDEGHWVNHAIGLVLGHRRLSIQDTSAAGHQPMVSSSGRYVISFNGEIYNFSSIASDLRARGHNFTGGSDTEVALAAFEEYGIEHALNAFTGMFAIALWDSVDQCLMLIRDRMGEKPLYFGVQNGDVVFGSELKVFRGATNIDLDIDVDSVSQLLRFGYIPAPRSIYKSIKKLTPGTYLRISRSNGGTISINEFSYWSLQEIVARSYDEDSAKSCNPIDGLDNLLRDSIRNQMIADVPIGAFLSGGIDSSTVVSIMQDLSSQPVQTFTIGFENPQFDETSYAREIAKYLGTTHNETTLSDQEILSIVPQLSGIYDEPFANASQLPSILVSDFAVQKVKVCLSGDGGDELFSGYNRYALTPNLSRKLHAIPSFARVGISKVVRLLASSLSRAMLDTLMTSLSRGSIKAQNVKKRLQKLAEVALCSNDADIYYRIISNTGTPAQFVSASTDTKCLLELLSDLIDAYGVNSAMLLWDQLVYLPGDNLAKVDRSSMSVSLETRLPLLDHGIVEFSWSTPARMARQQNSKQSKWLLRQVLSRYIPIALIDRPKMGFTVPIGEWLRGSLQHWAEDLLSRNSIESTGVFSPDSVSAIWHLHRNGSDEHAEVLWAILMYQSWAFSK